MKKLQRKNSPCLDFESVRLNFPPLWSFKNYKALSLRLGAVKK